MINQFGEPVPDDLVLMPNIKNLDKAEINLVDFATWYEVDGVLLVSARAIDYLSEDDPLDGGIDLNNIEQIDEIMPHLHRWSDNGFYHA